MMVGRYSAPCIKGVGQEPSPTHYPGWAANSKDAVVLLSENEETEEDESPSHCDFVNPAGKIDMA